jgi:uncharacterized damage-inducible protein DinB
MTTHIDRTRRPFVMEEAVAVLSRTPAALDALLRGLPDGWITAHEGGETWSPFDVVAHLVHCEHTDWMPRVRVILEHGDTRPFDPFDRFGHVALAKGRSLDSLLDELAIVRRSSLRDLRDLGLTEADLDRRGHHPGLGTVTLRELLATWMAHDLDHVFQISRVMARQYADAVGPWQAYLRIISGQPG